MAHPPLALCPLAFLLLLLLGSSHACNFLSGGAGAFSDVGPILVKEASANQKLNTSLPLSVYQTSSADLGVINFTAGVFCTSVADSPFSITQETTFAKAWPGAKLPTTNKYSLPLVITAFGFFVNPGVGKNGTAVFSLTWKDTFNLFYSGGKWDQPFESFTKDKVQAVKGAFDPAKTKVSPYSRSDPAGGTEVIKKFWAKAGGPTFSAPGIYNSVGETDGNPFPYNATTGKWFTSSGPYFVKGAAALCNQAATVVGAITYGQKTICLKIAPLVEVRLKNAAGTYIQSTDSAATPQQIIPRKYPASDAYWNAINTIFSPGQYTPPLATFIFLFARKNYTITNNGNIAKAFITYAVKNTGTIAAKLGYSAVPQNLTALNSGAVAQIITKK